MNDQFNETGEFSPETDLLPNDLNIILDVPSRLNWDVKAATPLFSTDFESSPQITATLLSATFCYACWTDKLGEPSCQGYGDKCPHHPATSSPGLILTMETSEFGRVVMTCYGLMYRWALGAAKSASRNGGTIETDGFKVINGKRGNFAIPGAK